MVLDKSELIGSLANESRILLHLISKVDPAHLDYRPTPKQRSTIELLRYLTFMGPQLIRIGKAGEFDPAAWSAREQAAASLDLDGVIEAVKAQPAEYYALLDGMTDAEFRAPVTIFGASSSRGAWIANQTIGGHAAYRTQLFLYLKSCGKTELSTMNLWGGRD